jgi:hypothetical protein
MTREATHSVPFMRDAKGYDADALLDDWRWLVPAKDTPLWVSAFGDWVFGAPDGSHWVLSTLEGDYKRVARNAAEYNKLARSPEWTSTTLLAEWFPIATGNGLYPGHDECLGWKLHPIIGGAFAVDNLQVFSMLVYQSVTGQLHRQLR